MAIHIKNPEVKRLADAVAKMTGESRTEAIRKSLEERLERLSSLYGRKKSRAALLDFLKHEIWSTIPPQQLGKELTTSEEEDILG